jgi:hypothetical protein
MPPFGLDAAENLPHSMLEPASNVLSPFVRCSGGARGKIIGLFATEIPNAHWNT